MVVDTMVLAYALLGEAELHAPAVEALKRAPELLAPESLRAELTNVIWLWIRHRGVDTAAGLAALRDAEALITEFVPLGQLWEEALELAVERDHSPYDTIFVVLARRRGMKVLTHDRPLADRFPEWTVPLLAKGTA
ncbi:MAG TPA: type II toxin-antitoxin system VapC family toxin [Thermoanaerobaculia bacterium]|nr:type II toxin-antitoxin system VapC family toxin [Thermoanaerobaculia bacterium]